MSRPSVRALLVGGLLLVGAGAFASEDAPPSAATGPLPKIEIEATEVNVGSVVKGEPALATFTIHNRGEGVLTIRAKPGCGCTLAEYDKEISAGGTGHIRATLNTEGIHGEFSKAITVSSNDPGNSKIVTTMRGTVVGSVEVLPYEVISLRTTPGKPTVGRVLVRQDATETGSMKITNLSTSVDWLVASARKLDDQRPGADGLPPSRAGDWLLELQVSGLPEYGRRRESVRFATGLPRQPSVSLTVFVDLEPPVHFSNDTLVLPRSGAGTATETVFISVRQDLDPSHLKLQADPKGLEVAMEPVNERVYKLTVGWKGDELNNASLLFRVDDESVRIPVELGPAVAAARR